MGVCNKDIPPTTHTSSICKVGTLEQVNGSENSYVGITCFIAIHAIMNEGYSYW